MKRRLLFVSTGGGVSTGTMTAALPNATAAFSGSTGGARLLPLQALLEGDFGLSGGTLAATMLGLQGELYADHGVTGALAAEISALGASLAGGSGAGGTVEAHFPALSAGWLGEMVIPTGTMDAVLNRNSDSAVSGVMVATL